jgi:hypothetical protein
MSVSFFLCLMSKTAVLIASVTISATTPRQLTEMTAKVGNSVTVSANDTQAKPACASDYYPMVHLRKLHLVRPDLIPYPIYYSVYC